MPTYAVASVSKNQNGVRSHVLKHKQDLQLFDGLIQVETKEYRELHKMGTHELMGRFMEKKFRHVIDVDELMIHTMDCDKHCRNSINASIINIETTKLKKCHYCFG